MDTTGNYYVKYKKLSSERKLVFVFSYVQCLDLKLCVPVNLWLHLHCFISLF